MTNLDLMIRRPPVLYFIFFLSGAAGLGYQMVWTRMFAVGLGHELPSMLAVVAAFFGGLAVGAWALDGRVSRSRVPGRWYAGLEGIIGLWAIVSVAAIPALNRLAVELIGLNPPAWRHWLVSFGVPFVGLLPATAAMGATLPAMERLVARLRRTGRTVAGLYAVNTAGAVTGTLLATYLVIPMVGYTRALLLMAAVNALCALGVGFGAAAGERGRAAVSAAMQGTPAAWRIGVLLFAGGLLGIGYEVLCVRVMGQIFYNTVYSYASVLSVYLVGTAVGAAIYQRFFRNAGFEAPLAWFLQLLCIACLLGVVILGKSREIYAAAGERFGGGVFGSISAEMVLAALVLLVPTILMGCTFSHLAQAARRDSGGIGTSLGINTIGAACAPVVFGVVLLTNLGARWTLVVVAFGYLGMVFLVPRLRVRRLLPSLAALPVLALAPQHLVLLDTPPGSEIVAYREGVMASVSVIKSPEGVRTLKMNNRFYQGGTWPGFAERRMAHIPLLLHPAPRTALFLGVGTAMTAGAGTYHEGLDVQGVDLVPEVIDLLSFFAPENRLEQVAPGSYVVADARRFVRSTSTRYDVIVGDLFHPNRDGTGALYTREHFQAVRDCLADGGLFCQWIPLYQIDEETLRVILRTFLAVFPRATAHVGHFNVDMTMLGLVGRTRDIDYRAGWYDERVGGNPALRGALDEVALSNAFTLFGTLIAGTDDLRAYAGRGPLNTDDEPLVNYRAPFFAYRDDEPSYGRIVSLLDACRYNPLDILSPPGTEAEREFAARLRLFLDARNLYLRAGVLSAEGRDEEALEALVRSAGISRDFKTAYAVLLQIVNQRMATDPQGARDLLRALDGH